MTIINIFLDVFLAIEVICAIVSICYTVKELINWNRKDDNNAVEPTSKHAGH